MKPVIALSCILAATALLGACTPPTKYPEVKKGEATEPPVQRERLAYLQKTAAVPITCTIGADCTEKWTRAKQWILSHAVYSIKTDTATEIATYGPIEPTTDSGFTVDMVQQDANTNGITFASSCGKLASQTVAGHCTPTTLELHSAFNNFVMYGN